MNSFIDLLDGLNVIDRIGGWVYGAARQGQAGRQIRIAHANDKSGRPIPGQTGNQYAEMLARYHIPVWSKRATSRGIMLNVRAGQWQWAVDLLTIYGAPVQHKARQWALARNGHMPTPWDAANRQWK